MADLTQEQIEDRALMEHGVVITGQRGQDPTHVWHLPSADALTSNAPDSDPEDQEHVPDPEPTITFVQEPRPGKPKTPRLLMKSGALAAEEFKRIPKHPYVINPDEDPLGILTPAKEPQTATFGGLIIGFEGERGVAKVPTEDYIYRGFQFQPGSNLGPEFPGDLNMTPYCVPKSLRVRQIENDEARRGQIRAHFTPSYDSGSSKFSYGSADPHDRKPEVNAEHAGEGDKGTEKKNVFVFFGKPQPIQPTDCPPVFPTSEETVLDYLDEHNLETFFEHVLALCLLDFRPNPYEFIADYCDKLIEARASLPKFETLTRVFYPAHVAAVYRLFDKQQIGHITLNKYRVGMEVLGLSRYTPDPDGYREDQITKETFYDEGCRALEVLLRSFMV